MISSFRASRKEVKNLQISGNRLKTRDETNTKREGSSNSQVINIDTTNTDTASVRVTGGVFLKASIVFGGPCCWRKLFDTWDIEKKVCNEATIFQMRGG